MRWLDRTAQYGLAFLGFALPAAHAGDFTLGVALGLGGAGISKTEIVDGSSQSIKRSESPGTVSLFLGYAASERIGLGLEHSRGFRFGPFSSGVGFTGLSGRWYFKSAFPGVSEVPVDSTYILVKRYAFFAGPALGVASGGISRENDQVLTTKSSGVYIGLVLGGDYQLAPGLGLRTQISSYMTFMSPATAPASMNYFSLGAGIFFFL